ncbi:hypothetical protein O3P69_015950 [Scylla paramamosain]|uniref:Ionotropic glutamate receptor C-terminal domain-containing protein n=2 Tax=Scylla paramamosain TaxID=85552 RepID=A0AAW0TAN2_SCYPA
MPFIYRRGPDQPVVGVSTEMLNYLASVLNFTFDLLEEPPDLKIGQRINVPCWQDGYGVFLRHPESLPKWVSAYRTFVPHVWALVLASLAITTVFFYAQARMLDPPFLGGAVETVIFVLRTMLNQGAQGVPRSSGVRIFLAAWFIGCLVLTTAYTSNLVALLTSPAYPKRVHSLRQLARSNYRYEATTDLPDHMTVCATPPK